MQGGPDAGPQLQDVLDHPGKSFHQYLLAILCLLDIEDLLLECDLPIYTSPSPITIDIDVDVTPVIRLGLGSNLPLRVGPCVLSCRSGSQVDNDILPLYEKSGLRESEQKTEEQWSVVPLAMLFSSPDERFLSAHSHIRTKGGHCFGKVFVVHTENGDKILIHFATRKKLPNKVFNYVFYTCR